MIRLTMPFKARIKENAPLWTGRLGSVSADPAKAISSCRKPLSTESSACQGVGKTPDSRMRPTVAVRQESRGMSLLRSRTARLKSRHCPTPDNLAPLYGDTLTSIPRPEGRKWGNYG